MSEVPLGEVVHFDAVTTNPVTGAASDADVTPTFAVYEESTDTDIGVGGNLTKRTSLTGNYRGSFTASTGNGFEAGKWYVVIASATVASIAGKAVAMRFRAVAAETTAGLRVVEPDAAVVRAAVGLASANLDTQITAIAGYLDTEVAAILAAVDTEVAAIKAKTDNLPAAPAAVGDIPSASANAAAVLAATVEATLSLQAVLRIALAALAGKASGLAGTSVTFRDVADSKNRIAATVDADGNRSAVTLDAS